MTRRGSETRSIAAILIAELVEAARGHARGKSTRISVPDGKNGGRGTETGLIHRLESIDAFLGLAFKTLGPISCTADVQKADRSGIGSCAGYSARR